MRTILKITLIAVALMLASCSNNETPRDQLPPITQTGENTFGCLVNGQVFLPKDKVGYSAPGGGIPRGLKIITGKKLPDYEYYSITARNYDGIYVYIYIAKEILLEETYTFSNSPGVTATSDTPANNHCFVFIYNSKLLTYENSGVITFTKVDYNNGLYAGTFNFKLKNVADRNDIVEITEGRFDINLNTLNQD